LSCLTNSPSVFPLISILSYSSEILSSTCFSLLEWPSTVFCFSAWFFFLRYSMTWVTSFLLFLFSSLIHLSLYSSCSLFHFGVYLGLFWVHLFVSVSCHIFYFWYLEISWLHLAYFGEPLLVSPPWNSQWLLARLLLWQFFCGHRWVPWCHLSLFCWCQELGIHLLHFSLNPVLNYFFEENGFYPPSSHCSTWYCAAMFLIG
jgi:hypothetical protein